MSSAFSCRKRRTAEAEEEPPAKRQEERLLEPIPSVRRYRPSTRSLSDEELRYIAAGGDDATRAAVDVELRLRGH